MARREILLLGEMIDAAEQAQVLVQGRTVIDIENDRHVRDALLWNFTVLGEAAAQLPDQFKRRHPAVNWSRPSQLRNRIVHGYWSIDMGILHTTATDDLPAFCGWRGGPPGVRRILGSRRAQAGRSRLRVMRVPSRENASRYSRMRRFATSRS